MDRETDLIKLSFYIPQTVLHCSIVTPYIEMGKHNINNYLTVTQVISDIRTQTDIYWL